MNEVKKELKSRISEETIRDEYKTYVKDGKTYTYMDDLPQLTFMRTARVTDEEFNELVKCLGSDDFKWFTKERLNFSEKRLLLELLKKVAEKRLDK